MALKLYFHPLASFCHKALIALYENRVPFEPIIVDLGDEASRAAFRAVWPMAKMPVLRDEARNRTVAESTIIIEFLDVRSGTHAEDRGRPAASRGQGRRVRRGPCNGAAPPGLRRDGTGDGLENLGDRRRLHLGRLRGGAGAVLREHRRSFCRHARKPRGLSRPPHGAPILCAGARGSAAVLPSISTGEKADNRQTRPRSEPLRRRAKQASR